MDKMSDPVRLEDCGIHYDDTLEAMIQKVKNAYASKITHYDRMNAEYERRRIYDCQGFLFPLLNHMRQHTTIRNFDSFYAVAIHTYKEMVNQQLKQYPANAAELIAFSEKLAEAFKASITRSTTPFANFVPQDSLRQTSASRRSSSSSAYPANWDQPFLQRRDSLEEPDPGQVPRPRPPPVFTELPLLSVDTVRPIGEQPRDTSFLPVHPSTGDTAHRILEDPVTLENCNIRPADTLAQMQQKVRDAYAHYLTQNRRAYASYMQERLSQCSTILDPLLRSLRSPTNDSAKTMQFYHQIIESQYNDDPKNRAELNTFIDNLGETFKTSRISQGHVSQPAATRVSTEPAARAMPRAEPLSTAASQHMHTSVQHGLLPNLPPLLLLSEFEKQQASDASPRNYPEIPDPSQEEEQVPRTVQRAKQEQVPRTVYRERQRVIPFRDFGIHHGDDLHSGLQKITDYHQQQGLSAEYAQEHRNTYEHVFHPIMSQMSNFDLHDTNHARNVLSQYMPVIDQLYEHHGPDIVKQKRDEAHMLVLVSLARHTKNNIAPARQPSTEPLPDWVLQTNVGDPHAMLLDLLLDIQAKSPDNATGAKRCTLFASKYWPLIKKGYYSNILPHAANAPAHMAIPGRATSPVFASHPQGIIHQQYAEVAEAGMFVPGIPIRLPNGQVVFGNAPPGQIPPQNLPPPQQFNSTPIARYPQVHPNQRVLGMPSQMPMQYMQGMPGQPVHFPSSQPIPYMPDQVMQYPMQAIPGRHMRGQPMQVFNMQHLMPARMHSPLNSDGNPLQHQTIVRSIY